MGARPEFQGTMSDTDNAGVRLHQSLWEVPGNLSLERYLSVLLSRMHPLVVLLTIVGTAFSYPEYSPSCTGVASPHSRALGGTGSFAFSIAGNPTTYTPGASYTITLSGGSMRGLLFYARLANGNRVGTF